jgi:hypothetical protein
VPDLLGLLVASISIDSQFGDLQLDDNVRKVALVCPLDTPDADPAAATYVLLRHPLYDQPSEAHVIDNNRLRAFAATDPQMTTDAHYHDPLFGDRFLASFARVPTTHIFVVVQQRYADALRAGVEPARRIVLWGGAALALAALAIAGASVVMINRRAGGTR